MSLLEKQILDYSRHCIASPYLAPGAIPGSRIHSRLVIARGNQPQGVDNEVLVERVEQATVETRGFIRETHSWFQQASIRRYV
jgi:hypothetical protein